VDARDQVKLGALLDMGHAYTGVEIVRPVKDGPTTVGHEPVTGAQLLMHLLRSAGWVVRLREPVATVTGDTPPRTGVSLRLMRGGAGPNAASEDEVAR
jgi:hypothetical protein